MTPVAPAAPVRAVAQPSAAPVPVPIGLPAVALASAAVSPEDQAKIQMLVDMGLGDQASVILNRFS